MNIWSCIALKRIVPRDDYFLKVLKIEIVLSDRLWFSQFLIVFLWRKSKMKFLFASMKSLTNFEMPSNNPLQRACSSFLIAACVSKSCTITCLWSWKLFWKLAMNLHWKKLTKESKGKLERKFDLAFGTIFRISVFKEASINFILIFLLN